MLYWERKKSDVWLSGAECSLKRINKKTYKGICRLCYVKRMSNTY